MDADELVARQHPADSR